MEPRSGAAARPTSEPVTPPRQRWRLVLARSLDAPRLAGRELSDAWETAVEATGLPLHRAAGRARTRVAFAAPLPLGIVAEGELAELFLTDRVPGWRVREAVAGALPTGWRLVDLFDVWVGGPPLAGRVIAADYRIELEDAVELEAVRAAAQRLLAARELVRVRQKGDTVVSYDLRPLLIDLAVVGDGSSLTLRVRTRIHPELGTGRPEEVVAALGERLGRGLVVRSIARERLVLAGQGD